MARTIRESVGRIDAEITSASAGGPVNIHIGAPYDNTNPDAYVRVLEADLGTVALAGDEDPADEMPSTYSVVVALPASAVPDAVAVTLKVTEAKVAEKLAEIFADAAQRLATTITVGQVRAYRVFLAGVESDGSGE
jgi:hypothetical protein